MRSSRLWSGRLSSGIFGLHNCAAGNRGPKSDTEVLVVPGDLGLEWLLRNNFLPCPVCKPNETEGFWEKAHVIVDNKYGAREIFESRDLTPFDARRLPWEEILAMTGAPPSRLYVPKGLSRQSIARLRDRFANVGHVLPPVGYYDAQAPGRFREYAVPKTR